MVTTNNNNNQVNLEQVCSLNIEQSRLLQKQTIEVKILPFMPPGFVLLVLSFPVSFLMSESRLDIFFAFGSENIVLLTHKVTANNIRQ